MKTIKILLVICSLVFFQHQLMAAKTTVNTLSALTTTFAAARGGDTIEVANGTYNWGQIVLTNANNTSTSAWIVLKAQSRSGVVFTGTTCLQFSGYRIQVDGFRFASGNSTTNAVLAFRSSSSNHAYYSRISNITIDNYNSNDTTENEWVGFFGTNNRLDHCTFINKSNPRATVVVWYSTATFPAQSISTYHRIDSNYFAGRSYMSSNGGETIRVGVGNNSRTFGYNIVEYNLFENCTQTEPEIVSNKSAYNTYRYNTFRNCNGGLTLRMGKNCTVYGNIFINNDPTKTGSYGIRIIDKGHKVFNNYCEGLLGSSGTLSSMRTPIVIYNGTYSAADSLNPLVLNGAYLPADSAIVVFNTIVNCAGGPGIKMGYADGGTSLFAPLGLKISNNLVKMSSGQAVHIDPLSTSLTYTAEGNVYNAPSGLGLTNTAGFVSRILSFQSVNGLQSPLAFIQDSAVNTASYASMLGVLDLQGQTRSSVYDVGCDETNGTGMVMNRPLDTNMVGAGKPILIPQSQTISFVGLPVKTMGNADFNPGATATSGLTVIYTSSNTAVATIVNGNIHLTGYGTATITASQAGNNIYAAATPVTQTLTVNGISQTISFAALPAKIVGDADFNPGATSTSGLAVTYASSNAAVATIVNNLIHVVGAGTAIITASQPGNSTYLPATNLTQALTVSRSVIYTPTSVTITSGSLSSGAFGNLATNNSSYIVVNSTTTGTRINDWYGVFKVTQPASSISKFVVSYDGKNSASKTQLIYLYNWSSLSWTQIDSRTVSTTDITVTFTQNSPANFISSTGEIRVRIYSSSGTSNYSCSGDWLQVAIQTTSANKSLSTGTQSDDHTINAILFPNPVQHQATLNYFLSKDSKVAIRITDEQGRLVKKLQDNTLTYSGEQIKSIETSSLSNGVYYLQILADDSRQVIKFIVAND